MSSSFTGAVTLSASSLLIVFLISQFAFFSLLSQGSFWLAYFANALFWTVGLVAWSFVLTRLQTGRNLLSGLLFFLCLGTEVGAWVLSDGFPDSAYCSLLFSEEKLNCLIPVSWAGAARGAGFFFIPITLITAVLWFVLTRPTARSSHLYVVGAGIITVGVLVAAFAAMVIFMVTHFSPRP